MNLTDKILNELENQSGDIRSICIADIAEGANFITGFDVAISLYRVLAEELSIKKFEEVCFLMILSYLPSSTQGVFSGVNSDISSIYFYLVRDDMIFSDAFEEYRQSVEISDPGVNLVFRSWRDEESAKNNWEFENALYIWQPIGNSKHLEFRNSGDTIAIPEFRGHNSN